MRKTGFSLALFGLLAVVSLPTTSAHAQATRTWVSGVGDDANPCSRTAPCKTFAGAISKTAAGGEIDCLDPGGFGAVTITKSMTIDCAGVTGGILSSLTNGVIVNAGVNDKVVLRNLNIQGVGNGINGVRWLAGKELQLDRVTLAGFTNAGVDISKSAAGTLFVTNSYFTEAAIGINMTSTAPFVIASVDNSNFNGLTTNGVAVGSNSIANITSSTFSSNSVTGATVSASGSFLNLNKNVFRNNGTGISAVAGTNLRTIDNDLFDNTTGINATGAGWVSAGNNRVVGGSTISNGTSSVMQVR